jgi:hypothetical protein
VASPSLAALNFQLYGDDNPYDGAALRRLPESKAAREAERLGVSSLDAAVLAHDLLHRQMLDWERSLVTALGSAAGRDLSDVDVTHVFIDSPNAVTLFDPNDRSYAIGIDPGYWHAIAFLYLDAALGQRVNDPRWFLLLATKTVQWIWIGSETDWTQDLDNTVRRIQETAPDLWGLARDVVNTAIAFTIAHEVGHIVLDHLEGPHATDLRLTDRRPASRASAMDSKDQELEADAWAADALFEWAGDDFKKRTLMVSVPALCFCLTALASEMRAPATNAIARATADTHPSGMTRAQALHTRARARASEVEPSGALKHFVELGFWVNEQRELLRREGMHWAPEWLRDRGLA